MYFVLEERIRPYNKLNGIPSLIFFVILAAGECKARFTSRKVPYCIKFHPEEDKQHLFVAGTSDKKIVCVS